MRVISGAWPVRPGVPARTQALLLRLGPPWRPGGQPPAWFPGGTGRRRRAGRPGHDHALRTPSHRWLVQCGSVASQSACHAASCRLSSSLRASPPRGQQQEREGNSGEHGCLDHLPGHVGVPQWRARQAARAVDPDHHRGAGSAVFPGRDFAEASRPVRRGPPGTHLRFGRGLAQDRGQPGRVLEQDRRDTMPRCLRLLGVTAGGGCPMTGAQRHERGSSQERREQPGDDGGLGICASARPAVSGGVLSAFSSLSPPSGALARPAGAGNSSGLLVWRGHLPPARREMDVDVAAVYPDGEGGSPPGGCRGQNPAGRRFKAGAGRRAANGAIRQLTPGEKDRFVGGLVPECIDRAGGVDQADRVPGNVDVGRAATPRAHI